MPQQIAGPAKSVTGALASALSAHRFEEHAAGFFEVSSQGLKLIQVVVANLSQLPRDSEALEQRSSGAAAALGPNTTEKMLHAYRQLQASADEWMSDRIPPIKSCADDIARYGSQAERTYRNVRSLIKQLAAGTHGKGAKRRDKILNRLNGEIGTLCKKARGYAGNAARVAGGSKRLVEGLRRSDAELQELTKSVEARRATLSAELEKIDAEIRSLLGKVHELNRQAQVHDARAEADAKLVWIPIAGVGFAVAAIAEAETAKGLASQADALTKRLEDAQKKQLNPDPVHAALALLEATAGWIASIGGDLAPVMPILGKVQGIWGAIADDLELIPETLRRIAFADDPGSILMEMDLDSAVLEWKALADKAAAFSRDFVLATGTELAFIASSPPFPSQHHG